MKRNKKVARLSAILLAIVWSNAAGAFVVLSNLVERDAAPILRIQTVKGENIGIFRGVGVVTAVDRSEGSLTINHEDIKGLMQAMEMSFRVDPQSLIDKVRPGDKIDFAVEGKTYTIKKIEVIGHGE